MISSPISLPSSLSLTPTCHHYAVKYKEGSRLMMGSYTVAVHDGQENPFDVVVDVQSDDDEDDQQQHTDDVFTPIVPVKQQQSQQQRLTQHQQQKQHHQPQPSTSQPQSRLSRPPPPSQQRPGLPACPADDSSAPGTPNHELPSTPTPTLSTNSSASSTTSSGGMSSTIRRRPTIPSAGDFVDEETPDLEFDESDFLTALTICMIT